MKRYFVYIVRCQDNSYYTGITNNLGQRINQHNEGIDTSSYTYFRRPVQLLFAEEFTNSLHAIAAEKQIKGWSRKKKEALINRDIAFLKKLAECRNNSHYRNHK